MAERSQNKMKKEDAEEPKNTGWDGQTQKVQSDKGKG